VVLLACACCGVLSSLLLIYGIYRVSDQTVPESVSSRFQPSHACALNV
jgi:hypothetical protein